MEKVKVLIVEDQSLIAHDIAGKLSNHDMEVAQICPSGERAIEVVEKLSPDLILMDIQLAGALDGISTAKFIREKIDIPIIFLSDYTDQATVNRAKQTFPANYLSKPFNETDLIRAIDLALYNAKANKGSSPKSEARKYVFLKDNFLYKKVAYDEIVLLKAERAYCTLITDKASFTFSKSMNKIAEQLDHPNLFRIHRSYIININKITAINGNLISLGEHTADLSKELREEFLNKIKFIK